MCTGACWCDCWVQDGIKYSGRWVWPRREMADTNSHSRFTPLGISTEGDG
jgi:hypothetical protein